MAKVKGTQNGIYCPNITIFMHLDMNPCGQVHILLGTCIIIVSTSSLYFCLSFLSINQEMHVLVNQIHIKYMYIHIIRVITWNMKKGNVRN